jgi:hypothetical protein
MDELAWVSDCKWYVIDIEDPRLDEEDDARVFNLYGEVSQTYIYIVSSYQLVFHKRKSRSYQGASQLW